MGGALLDLVAKGGQDIYLICNPQISFFKKVYKRHTNFSVEFHKFFLDGDADFGKSTRVFIPRRGDLIKNMYLHIELPDLVPSGNAASYANFIGYNLIEYVEIYIGNSLIDRQTGEWLYIWNELSTEESKKRAYYEMVGGKPFAGYSSYSGNQGGTYIVPLSFWFGKDISQAIPHLALQYSEIEFKIKFRDFNDLWISSDNVKPTGAYKIINCQLSVEYIYLDNKERKLFAQSNHEYLIKQTQYSINNSVKPGEKKKTFNLNFNHPVLELIFFVTNKSTGRETSENSGSGTRSLRENEDSTRSIKDSVDYLSRWDAMASLTSNTRRGLLSTVFYDDSFGISEEQARNIDPYGGYDTTNFLYQWYFSLVFKLATEITSSDRNRPQSLSELEKAVPEFNLTQMKNISPYGETRSVISNLKSISNLQEKIKNLSKNKSKFTNTKEKPKNINRNTRNTPANTDAYKRKNNWLNFSKTLTAPFSDPIKSAKILLNGQDRTPEMTSKELRFYNILEKHTSIPNNFIYVYSFSQNPEDYQPTGTSNFSRFDNKQIEVEFEEGIENSDFKIYALNYNVLRISQGLAGLAYIN